MLQSPAVYLDPVALLGRNRWQQAKESFAVADEEEAGELTLLQQELLFERRLDREMYGCLQLEAADLKSWLATHPSHPSAADVSRYLRWLEPNLQPNEILNFAPELFLKKSGDQQSREWHAVFAWTEQCKTWARELLLWRTENPEHPACAPLELWFDDPGLLPQVRLLVWSLRTYEYPLAEDILSLHREHRNGIFPLTRPAERAS